MEKQQLDAILENSPFMSLGDAVHEVLLQDIVSFRLHPGCRLNESSISRALGVSRSPIKSAIEKLAVKSYVSFRDNRYYVADFSYKEYKNVTDLAMIMDSYAAGEAAKNISSEQLDKLYAMATRLKGLYGKSIRSVVDGANLGYRELIEQDMDFHSYIVKASGNRVLSEIYEENKFKLFRYRSYLLFSPPNGIGIYEMLEDDHLTLCDLIKLGDPDIASATAKRHLSISKVAIQKSGLLNFEDEEY